MKIYLALNKLVVSVEKSITVLLEYKKWTCFKVTYFCELSRLKRYKAILTLNL